MNDIRTGFYSPFWANMEGQWYSCPELDAVWTAKYDLLLEELVDRHAPFILPFAKDIVAQLDSDNGTRLLETVHIPEYFVLTRAYKLPHTRAKWLAGVERERTRVFTCPICNGQQATMSLHPDLIREYGTTPPWCRTCNYVVRRYAKFWTDDIRQRVGHLMQRVATPSPCDVCGAVFTLEKDIFTRHTTGGQLVDTLYPNLFAQVCPACMQAAFADNQKNTAKHRLQRLHDLFTFVGKVPTKDYASFFYLYRDRDSIVTLIGILKECRTPDGYAQDCGSFFEALVAAGVLPKGSRRMRMGAITRAKDGHICFSVPEKDIDDFLSDRGLPHAKEVSYPESGLRADWEIAGTTPRTFIEFFGLTGNPAYDLKTQRKRDIARQHGIHLIELMPADDWKATITGWMNDRNKPENGVSTQGVVSTITENVGFGGDMTEDTATIRKWDEDSLEASMPRGRISTFHNSA